MQAKGAATLISIVQHLSGHRLAKKHEDLATSKLVLWSRSGFTKAAHTKAAALKIDTVSQATAARADWATLARSLIGGHVQLVTPKFSPFIDIQPPEGEPFRLEEVGTLLIYDANGNVVQSIPSILAFMAESPELGTTLLDHAPIGSGDFYAEVRPPVPWFVDTPEGTRASIVRVGVGVTTFVERLTLKTASATVEDRVATHLQTRHRAGFSSMSRKRRMDQNPSRVQPYGRRDRPGR